MKGLPTSDNGFSGAEKDPHTSADAELGLSNEGIAESVASHPSYRQLLLLPVALACLILLHGTAHLHKGHDYASANLCAQSPPLAPPPSPADANREIIFSDDYRRKAAGKLSGLVQIPSESYDDNGPVEGDQRDPRWDTFNPIPAYLAEQFPLLHDKLNLTLVNTHGLLYVWEGSDPSLKASLFMAHTDVVPVNPATVDEWTHPPYSGFYDGKSLYGRGSVDCKDTLTAILEAVELLVASDFQPRRTIMLSFGFDEESAGVNGAGQLSAHIEKTYGKDSVAFIIDEGGGGIGESFGTAMALPGTSEKGYIDVEISLHAPGGHSSVPPDHTSIGILASLITKMEASPFTPTLSETSPIFSLLQCAATHGELSTSLKAHVLAASVPGKAGDLGRQKLAEAYAQEGKEQRYLVQTSQAIDVISGGVKVNALPEVVSFTSNYRIDITSSPEFVQKKITKLMLNLAKEHNLDVDAFGTLIPASDTSSASGGLLKAVGIGAHGAAPVSLTTSKTWALLSGTIRHAFSNKFPAGLIVSPGMDTGNTDTFFYWNFNAEMYRFSPSDPSSNEFIHTVDEHLDFDQHIQGIFFFHELMRTADAADL